jgi:trans-aconitate methyltransferase
VVGISTRHDDDRAGRDRVGDSPDHDDWDAHWDDYAPAARLSPAQIYRRGLTLRLLERRGTPRRLVDFGSGTGELLDDASRRWPDAALLGLELSASGVEYAKATVPRAKFLQANLEEESEGAPRYNGWATHAACSEVLEHVDDPIMLLRNARWFLAGGARLVVTVPGGTISAFDRHIGHRRHYTPELLEQTFSEAGLATALVARAGFPFFNFYRWVVIKRGEKIVDDVLAAAGSLSLPARLAMLAFTPLLMVSLPRSPWGKQIVGIAYEPAKADSEDGVPDALLPDGDRIEPPK